MHAAMLTPDHKLCCLTIYLPQSVCWTVALRCMTFSTLMCVVAHSNVAFYCQIGCGTQGKNVKSIIDDWTKELQSHSRAFVEDAQKLAAWDEHIRLKRRELLEMEAHLEQVHHLSPSCFLHCLAFTQQSWLLHLLNSVTTQAGVRHCDSTETGV